MNNINILDYIPKGRANAIPRARLRYITGLTDSKMRELIRQARHDVPILNLQTGEGYYIPDNKEEVKKYIKQEEHRAKSIFANLKSAKDYLNKMEHQMYFFGDMVFDDEKEREEKENQDQLYADFERDCLIEMGELE